MSILKEHYVYKITNIQTLQYYIGVRSTKNIDTDTYMGSSFVWRKDYIQDHKEELKKEILSVYESRKLANEGELFYLKIAEGDSLCVNILYKKIPSSFGKKQSPEHITKRIHSGKKAPMYGKHHTPEAKKKISENSASKGKPMTDKLKAIMLKIHTGKIVSEETKLKQSQTKKAKIASGEIKNVSKSVEVIDLLKGVTTHFKSLKEFTNKEGLNYGSVKVYVRKQMIYKERYKITYTSKLKIQD